MDTNNSKFFLGIPAHSLLVAYPLSLLDDLFSEGSVIDYGNSSYPHTTTISPRPLLAGSYLEEAERIIAARPAQEIIAVKLDFFEPNRIVLLIEAPWLKQLHRDLLTIGSFPQGDPTYEGTAYNPHISVAKVLDGDPEPHMQFLSGLITLPIAWTPSCVTLFVKPPGGRFTETKQLYFLNCSPP